MNHWLCLWEIHVLELIYYMFNMELKMETNSYLTWVPSDLNLANSLTKASNEAYREMRLFNTRKSWVVRFNSEFVSARKAQRLRTQKTKEEKNQNLHLCSVPEDWYDDAWTAMLTGDQSPYQR